MTALTSPVEILLRWAPGIFLLILVLLAVPGWSAALTAIVLQVLILAQIASHFTSLRLSSVHNWALSLGLYFPITFCLTLVGAYVHVHALSWLAIAVLGLALAAYRTWGTATRNFVSHSSQLEWSAVAVALVITSVLNRFQFLKYGFMESPSLSEIHIDNIGHQFIINATQLEGPGASGYLSDWSLRYHWLSFLWVGHVEHQFSLAQFTGLLFLLPWLSLLGMAIGIASLTALLTRSRIARFLAPSLALAGQLPGSGIAENVNWDSASQMTSGLMLLGGILLVLMLNRTRKFEALVIATLVPLSFALVGTKVSAAVILLLATTGACLTRRLDEGLQLWRRLVPAFAVASGSLAGYWYFVSGQESGGLLRPRWVADTATAVPQSISTNFDALSLSIVLGSVFVVLPLLLTRKWADQHSVFGVNAATLAVLGGLVPVLVLEPVLPNTTWFLTSALLIAIPTAMAQAANTALPNTRMSFGFAALVSGVLAVAWVLALYAGVAIVTAQVLLLACAWAASLPFLFRIRPGHRYRRVVAIGSLNSLLILVTLVPAEAVASRFGFLNQLSTTDFPAASSGATSDTNLQSGIPDQSRAVGELKPLLPPGSEVLVPVDLGEPALVWAADNQLRPFLALPEYGAALGPQGSQREVERRQKLITGVLDNAREESLAALCREGVVGIVQSSEEASDQHHGFRIEVLPCDGVQW